MARSMADMPARARDAVTAFEAAWVVRGEADLAAFLPPRGDRGRPAVLRDLIRLDLDFRRGSGRPRRLEEYHGDFPELRRGDLADLALAEYLLRRDAGEYVTPAEYRERFDVETGDWPGPVIGPGLRRDPGCSGLPRSWAMDGHRSDDPASVARSYLDFRIGGEGEDAAGTVEGWVDATRDAGDAETVDVLAEPRRADPGQAARLAEAVVRMPEPGDSFLGFRLIGELGRGSCGRVFLASQVEMADRPVALKVSVDKPAESRTLA